MFIILLLTALYFGGSFLVPVTFAIFFAFLFLPVSQWLEKRGTGRGLAAFLAVLLLIAAFAVIGSLLTWQLSHMADDMNAMKENFGKKSEQIAAYINKIFGISSPRQKQFIKQQTSSIAYTVSSAVASIGTILTKTIIVLVYTFLFIYYRSHFRKFIMQLMQRDKQQETMEVIDNSGKLTQRYITGLFSMIFFLWIMYGIGFSLIGIKNAVFFCHPLRLTRVNTLCRKPYRKCNNNFRYHYSRRKQHNDN
ncbi:MAG: AI-2E family transporter [Segetibacter sp.]